MRILAIRGCNLASLAGEFEIDLAHAPLGDAGVFAIVGNTGAGKSTLLDALCVALFDRTPRLTNHSRVVVGRGDDDPGALGAQDVRTLLRRGAAIGWAEVDFESGDARRYRARWSVRRARGQTDGTLQDQHVTLTAIDGPGNERLGGTKTETLKAIVARLGLSFDQFRRSALLAQGEFAAFLRADGRDRSELLERMTGTEIYSRLSVAAHLRATLAEQRLRDGRAGALAIAVLEDVARSTAEAELGLAHEARAAARARFAEAETAARWLAEAARRDRALGEAEVEHAAAIAAAIAAEPERAELALRRRAEQLRAPWEDAARIERALHIVRGETLAADEAMRRAGDALAEVATRRAELAAVHAPVRAARLAAAIVERVAPPSERTAREPIAGGPEEPEERGARSARPDEGGPEEPRARSARPDEGGPEEPRARSARIDVVRGAATAAAWLAVRAGLANEIVGWGELDARFAQHAVLGDTITALDRALRDHTEARGKLARARDKVIAEQQAATAKLGEAQRTAESYHKRRGMTLDAARKQEDEARTRLTEVERLVAIAAGARSAVVARDEIDHQRADLEAAGRGDAEHRARIATAQVGAVAVRAERARVVDELRRAAGYEHARAELRDGEACPLCGALDHPWRDRGAFDEVIGDAEARLAEVMAELDAHVGALAQLVAREHQRERERERLVKHRAVVVATAEAAIGTWRAKLAALGELQLEGDPATASAGALAADREAAARKRLDEARAVRHQTEAATKAAQEAQAEVQLCQTTVDQLQMLVAEHDRRLAELDAAIERQHGERAGRAERRCELAVELASAIARWRAALPPEPERTRRPSEHVALPAEAVVARSSLAGAPESSLGDVRGALAELAAAWRVHAERVAIADAAGTAALAAIDRDGREAERAVVEHTARHADCSRRRAALDVDDAAAAARLEAARLAAGFDAHELSRLLMSDASHVERLAERLARLDREVERAAAVVAERRRLVADHAVVRPAALDDAAQVDALAAAVGLADELAARLVATLAADDDARARRAAALAMVASAEADAEVDRVLGAVIGSHDGKLFRSFAQSLTLDGLLAVANGHLEELAPRYQLERVPRHDLELQVIDRDLGAEVRSVQSLSGGESFLVSLALALGLSSMSAHDVRVRTLLIDEGFGTLDPATLDSALSVLDALQATGRQVGVISHVPALVERVGAHVRVVQRGGGRSEVIVASS